jgi:glycosyltransferase involved in cell wall biosynthesis
MKMLVVAPQPFFWPRGTPLSVYYRALVMAEQGVDIDLLAYGTGQDVDIPGVRVVRIPRIRVFEPIPIGPSWKKLFLDGFMILWTIALLLRYRYRVVHAHEEAVFWCRMLKPIFRFNLIYDMHSSLPQQLTNFKFTRSKWLVKTFKWLEDSCLRAATAVITICPALQGYALETEVPPERHFLIENCIFEDVKLRKKAKSDAPLDARSAAVQFNPSQPTVLYAGTFEAYQGIDVLVKAFAIVAQQRSGARLLIAGGTEAQVGEIRSLVKALNLDDVCLLTGRVSKSEAMRYTREAQVLVSSRIDGTNTPLKIYEQLASGKPLVATRIWSHTQVLDDRTCYLVEPTPESMAVGLLEALDDLGRNTERVANARALYEREYSRSVYEGKIRDLLKTVS